VVNRWPQFLVVVAFLACYLLTAPDYIGDTTRYVNDALTRAAGRPAPFWEFGHLIWRPWAHFGMATLGYGYQDDLPAQAGARFLIHTNLAAAIGVLLLLLALLRRVAPAILAVTAVVAVSCSNAFLTYSHSGTPYIPALLFSTATVLWLVKAAEDSARGRRYGLLAGVSFAIACALWFPFSVTGLALLLIPYLWPGKREPGRAPGVVAASFLAALTSVTVVLFAGAAAIEGIDSAGEFRTWIRESDNGWAQSLNVVRGITGVPRAVWNFGEDTILLKRRVFSDPFNPVRVAPLAVGLGGKLALFYLGLLAALWILWNESRRILLLCCAAGLPLLFFAIVVFEPSSPERFLPAIPFAALAIAIVLDRASAHRAAAAAVMLLLTASTVINLVQNGKTAAEDRVAAAAQRIHALNQTVAPGALVYLVTMNDDMYRLPNVNPLDRRLVFRTFWYMDAVEIASTRLARWRAEFGDWTQQQWAAGKEVWISERLLAERPEAHWLWVEGDSPDIRWSELPAFFAEFEFDRQVLPGEDGFVRVAQSPANHERLAKLGR
jgi:hypothetical protein